MQPGQLVVVFGGGDISNVPGYDADPLQTRIFVSDSTDKVGNGFANGGDFFLLISPDGAYDLYFGYNSKYNSGPPTSAVVEGIDFEIKMQTAAAAGNNNSVTRNPDGDISIDDPFVEHNTVSDNEFSPGQTINGENSIQTGVADNTSNGLPRDFKLEQNYPNPFNPTTTIGFDVPKSSNISIKVYNIQGQEIRSLVNKNYSPGRYEISWNARTNSGQLVPSGIYFYKIEADGFSAKQKMILLK